MNYIGTVYRLNVDHTTFAPQDYFTFNESYIGTGDVILSQDRIEISFSKRFTILIGLQLSGKLSPTASEAGKSLVTLWARMTGLNITQDIYTVGNEYAGGFTAITDVVDTSTVIKVQNIGNYSLTVGGGSIAGSRLFIVIL